MTNAVGADAFHDSPVLTPMLRERTHCVIAAVVDGAGLPSALCGAVDVAKSSVGVFEHVSHGQAPPLRPDGVSEWRSTVCSHLAARQFRWQHGTTGMAGVAHWSSRSGDSGLGAVRQPRSASFVLSACAASSRKSNTTSSTDVSAGSAISIRATSEASHNAARSRSISSAARLAHSCGPSHKGSVPLQHHSSATAGLLSDGVQERRESRVLGP